MERINYRITLDTQKTGVQGMLQGFQTGDKLSRRISINLAAGGDTIEIPVDATACIYVTAPNATETGIHACRIEGNTIIYDVLPITEAGIAMMQVKVFESSVDGAEAILFAPSFAVEVSASSTGDEGAESTVQFTALEQAIAKASAVYNARVQSIEVDADCTFRVIYADGTVYESSALSEAIYNGNALVAESFAHGGTGIRAGEDTDNAKYYSNVSRSANEGARLHAEEAEANAEESRLNTSFTSFSVDFDSGELVYMSANYTFDINKETGELNAISDGSYDPEAIVGSAVQEFIDTKSAEMDENINEMNRKIDDTNNDVEALEKKQEATETDLDSLEGVVEAFDTLLNQIAPGGIVDILHGGTGATTKEQALINLGILATLDEINKLAGLITTKEELTRISGLSASSAELNYVKGVTSAIQTQLDGKSPSSHNHSASNITSGTLGLARGGTGGTSASSARSSLGASALPVYAGSATSGTLRFPDTKMQIAWRQVSWTGAITTAWNQGAESAEISMGNWSQAFSETPTVAYSSRTGGHGNWVCNHESPSKTSAGSVYLERQSVETTSRTYYATAIGIGKYS